MYLKATGIDIRQRPDTVEFTTILVPPLFRLYNVFTTFYNKLMINSPYDFNITG